MLFFPIPDVISSVGGTRDLGSILGWVEENGKDWLTCISMIILGGATYSIRKILISEEGSNLSALFQNQVIYTPRLKTRQKGKTILKT